MTDLEYWQSYLSEYGLIASDPHGQTGNGLMYSAAFAWWLVETKPEHWESILHILQMSYMSCWVSNGGMNRAPAGGYATHYQQADDYYGVAWFDTIVSVIFINSNFSKRLLYVARNNHGILNNINPGVFKWKQWIFRHPGLKPTLQFAAGEKPGPYAITIWSITLLFSIFKFKHRDSRIKAFMMCKVVQGKTKVTDLVIKFWFWRFNKRFKGYGDAEYFNWDHPSKQFLSNWN